MTNQPDLRAKYRLAFGFFVGPLVPGVLLGLFSFMNKGSLSSLGFCISLAVVLGYPVAALLGGPLFLLMQRYRFVKMYYYLLAGSILGLISIFVANVDKLRFMSLTDIFGYYFTPHHMFLGAIMGMIATMSFWLIVRPDRYTYSGGGP